MKLNAVKTVFVVLDVNGLGDIVPRGVLLTKTIIIG